MDKLQMRTGILLGPPHPPPTPPGSGTHFHGVFSAPRCMKYEQAQTVQPCCGNVCSSLILGGLGVCDAFLLCDKM